VSTAAVLRNFDNMTRLPIYLLFGANPQFDWLSINSDLKRGTSQIVEFINYWEAEGFLSIHSIEWGIRPSWWDTTQTDGITTRALCEIAIADSISGRL
jgi:hypothetical protein